jgi:hypothetical protein
LTRLSRGRTAPRARGPAQEGGNTGRGVGAELEDSTLSPNLATHGDDTMTQKGRPEAALH